MNKLKILRYTYPIMYGGLFAAVTSYYTDYNVYIAICMALPFVAINSIFSVYIMDKIKLQPKEMV